MTACAPVEEGASVSITAATRADNVPTPDYLGVDTRLLEGDLVRFVVQMRRPGHPDALDDYARCAAAQYALIRGYGFARHVRTRLSRGQGADTWQADAVYTISPALPRGVQTIDAEVVVDNCAAQGIPTV
ncbi:hypothetical protein [Rhodovulum bhavnagarense]|uniref:hypothetical protein n=1 Tax=Rhodovulum bhavnagarense TaxID=992286 RepID=UPI003C7BAE11